MSKTQFNPGDKVRINGIKEIGIFTGRRNMGGFWIILFKDNSTMLTPSIKLLSKVKEKKMNTDYLKFRVWNEKTKNFTQFRPCDDPEWFVYNLLDPIEHNHIRKGMGTPEQCVGKRDMNKKLVFVGDILLRRLENYIPGKGIVKTLLVYQVIFEGMTFRIIGINVNDSAIIWTPETMEVIGNIHENPELLPEYIIDNEDNSKQPIKEEPKIIIKENVPSWCKVGAWFYCKGATFEDYEKITEIGEIALISKNKSYPITYCREARARKLTPEEMKPLVGRIVSYSGNKSLVTDYLTSNSANPCLIINGNAYTASQLLEKEMIYVLEHKEGNNWVK